MLLINLVIRNHTHGQRRAISDFFSTMPYDTTIAGPHPQTDLEAQAAGSGDAIELRSLSHLRSPPPAAISSRPGYLPRQPTTPLPPSTPNCLSFFASPVISPMTPDYAREGAGPGSAPAAGYQGQGQGQARGEYQVSPVHSLPDLRSGGFEFGFADQGVTGQGVNGAGGRQVSVHAKRERKGRAGPPKASANGKKNQKNAGGMMERSDTLTTIHSETEVGAGAGGFVNGEELFAIASDEEYEESPFRA